MCVEVKVNVWLARCFQASKLRNPNTPVSPIRCLDILTIDCLVPKEPEEEKAIQPQGQAQPEY